MTGKVTTGDSKLNSGKKPTATSELSKLAGKAKTPVKKGSVSPSAANATVDKAKMAAAAAKAWQSDPTYIAARGALQQQLQQYGDNLATQGTRYDTQYNDDLQHLGYTTPQGGRYNIESGGSFGYHPQLTTAKNGQNFSHTNLLEPTTSKAPGEWNQLDQNTASGKQYTDMNNDYAARGMLQSTGHVQALHDLGTSLGNQLSQASTARGNYLSDLGTQATTYGQQSNDNLSQAKLNATQTALAQYQTNAVRAAAGIGG